MPIVGAQGKPVYFVANLVISPNEMLVFFVRCSYGRLALQSAYEALNVGVHVLGVVTSLACGCVSTPTSQVICAMENVPNGKILLIWAVVLVLVVSFLRACAMTFW